jgi:ABC-type lipoprotein export system ATPase subunit
MSEPGRPVLRAVGLRKSYRLGRVTVEVLRGVSLEAARGEFVAVVGPSGSGKSTLIMLLAGIDVPDSGYVVVDGVRVSSLGAGERAAWRRRNVGIVFQFFHLVPTLTALENVMLAAELAGLPGGEARRRAEELLDFVGLSGKYDRFPSELSGGEQQRVAIARALVHRPKVLLADEPTANLDYENKLRIVRLLRGAAEMGTTVVFATHDPNLASEADKIVELRDGRVVRVEALR